MALSEEDKKYINDVVYKHSYDVADVVCKMTMVVLAVIIITSFVSCCVSHSN